VTSSETRITNSLSEPSSTGISRGVITGEPRTTNTSVESRYNISRWTVTSAALLDAIGMSTDVVHLHR